MNPSGLEMVGWGARTAIGLDAMQTGFGLRAGRSRMRDTLFADSFGDPVRMSVLDTLPQDCSGSERLAAIAGPAACEAIERAGARDRRIGLVLALGLTVAEPAARDALERVRSAVSELASVSWAELVREEGAAGAKALELAAQRLASPDTDLVVVGGAHSDYDWPTLEAALAADRIVHPDNVDGFVPGEGAAFVVLRSPDTRRSNDRAPIARIAGAAHVTPLAPTSEKSPRAADAISRALDQAAVQIRGRSTNFWYVDLTNEIEKARELQIVCARFGDLLGEQTRLQTPLSDLGNLGAASLPVFWVLAIESWVRGYALDDLAVFLAGSTDGSRSAVLLEEIPWETR